MSCQTQLMEVCQLKHKLEETLRQKERELTALKGALKDEVATHDKEIEVLREQYRVDMEKLRSSMEQVSEVCVCVRTQKSSTFDNNFNTSTLSYKRPIKVKKK